MSRLPLPQTWCRKCENVGSYYFLDTEVVTNVTCQMINRETQLDPVLPQVCNYVISGWPHVVDPSLVPFKTREDELNTQKGCLLWGARLSVPPSLQKKVLQELRDIHHEIYRMKALARSYLWWPNRDSNIELFLHVVHASLWDQMVLQFKFIPGPSQHKRGIAFTWILLSQFLAVPTLWL